MPSQPDRAPDKVDKTPPVDRSVNLQPNSRSGSDRGKYRKTVPSASESADDRLRMLARETAKAYLDWRKYEENEPDESGVAAVADRLRPLVTENAALRDALIWCSGSADFGLGGMAHEGWMKLCDPLVNRKAMEDPSKGKGEKDAPQTTG